MEILINTLLRGCLDVSDMQLMLARSFVPVQSTRDVTRSEMNLMAA